jgi:hypothetical protein
MAVGIFVGWIVCFFILAMRVGFAQAKLPPDRYEKNEDGEFDELWLRQASVHVERMDKGHMWMQFIAPDGVEYTFDLFSGGNRIDVASRIFTPIDDKSRSG